ncbi:hypothetical protein p1B266 (plasmid) [Aromatoleum aromaticum EbN1]|uniref:Uncharacterized protein n=1 Tax=Aromatoleum aromaticum (strain DSM 19018 / LMG 30748 / EbN1) TaxID=76114 RepID=Q5NWW3_AROAE|nr:hypothetical protein [Aromatoleum aromaticum]CAI10451.1 hypothetical protein p1B266 [Aromatoleum aromaticum EbN1]
MSEQSKKYAVCWENDCGYGTVPGVNYLGLSTSIILAGGSEA